MAAADMSCQWNRTKRLTALAVASQEHKSKIVQYSSDRMR